MGFKSVVYDQGNFYENLVSLVNFKFTYDVFYGVDVGFDLLRVSIHVVTSG